MRKAILKHSLFAMLLPISFRMGRWVCYFFFLYIRSFLRLVLLYINSKGLQMLYIKKDCVKPNAVQHCLQLKIQFLMN